MAEDSTIQPPPDALAALRVQGNLAMQLILTVAVTCRMTTGLFSMDFSWTRTLTCLLVIVAGLGMVAAFFAALAGHQPSLELLRAGWRTEKGSRRFALLNVVLVAGLTVRWLMPEQLPLYIVGLIPAGVAYWWLMRKAKLSRS